MAAKFGMLGAGVLAAMLASCGGGDKADQQKQGDAALSAALNDPIMVEPDLSSLDQSRAGLTAGEPGGTAVPLVDRGEAAIVAARDEALRLAGGKIAPVPPATGAEDKAPAFAAMTAEQLAAAVPGAAPECAKAMRYGMAWAARLPDAVTPYPRSNALEAAGNDASGCGLVAATFVTPVGVQDVIGFFHARLAASGAKPAVAQADGATLLTTTSRQSARLVRVRERGDGLVEVGLAARQ